MKESSTSDGGRILRNALSAYGRYALLGVSVVLLTPFLFRRLGAGGFGTWSVMFTLLMVSELVETGLSAGVIKLVAEHRGRGDREGVESTIRFGMLLMAGAGACAAAVAVCAGELLGGLAGAGDRAAFARGMLVLAAAILVRYPGVALLAALKGYQRFDLANLADGVYLLVYAVGAAVAVGLGFGVVGVAVAYAVGMVLSVALAGVLLHRVDPRLRIAPHRGTSESRRGVMNTSTFAFLAESMVFVGQRLDVIVIAAVRNAATAAPFAAALKLQSAVQAATLPVVRLLMPMSSELWARGARDEVVRRTTAATRAVLQLTLPVAFGAALFARDLVHVWLGPAAPRVTATIIVVLMAVQVSTLTAAPAETVLVGVGRARWVGALALVEGLSNVGLTVVLVIRFGSIGAAFGTLATSAALAPLRYPLVCRALGTSTVAFLRDSLGIAIVSSLPALAGMTAVWATLPTGTPRLGLAVAVGAVAVAAVGCVQLGVRRVLRLVQRPRRRPELSFGEMTAVGMDVPAGTAG